ncbi:uncharacterized protein ATNIH1004_010522 [Aspergillus tanneri]|uniref:Peptidase M12A domain-containing protein n=1 Tax=Aspergillus tanneri TaxID=1220188 RepID=A0A5M9MA31_9EURO|nr:uncharacterized protein ATNIH1004_010522 [Aspergillus tanneri]KAA8643748.1 hypothetical protein ATNIH1004_010522 [Aspergillus tanneri]
MAAAINLWYAPSLPEAFRFKHIRDRSECRRKHKDALLVEYNPTAANFQKYVGKVVHPETDGTTAVLRDHGDIVAHEIGHVFGLYHEHQSHGFQQGIHYLMDEEVCGPNGVCVNQAVTSAYGFTASEFLLVHLTTRFMRREPARAPIEADVDWKSLMLYARSSGLKISIPPAWLTSRP